MTRNLVATGTMTEHKAERLRAIMEREVPDAEVKGYEPLISAMQNHEKDRHVVAAAVKSGAQDLAKPAMSFDELLERLARTVPDLVAAVHLELGTSGGI